MCASLSTLLRKPCVRTLCAGCDVRTLIGCEPVQQPWCSSSSTSNNNAARSCCMALTIMTMGSCKQRLCRSLLGGQESSYVIATATAYLPTRDSRALDGRGGHIIDRTILCVTWYCRRRLLLDYATILVLSASLSSSYRDLSRLALLASTSI